MLSMDSWMNIIQTLIIGVVGLYLAAQANQLSNMQLKLSMAQSIPQFRVNLKQDYNDEIGIVDAHTIEISCEEGFFTNYDSSVVCFITVGGLTDCDIQIPLHGYWGVCSLTGNTNGTVETILGLGNHSKIKAVYEELRYLADEAISLDVENYLKISYIDILGEQQYRYYYVQPVRGTTIIDEAICESKIQLYDESFYNGNYINVDAWTSEDLEQLILQYTSQEVEK